MPCERPNCVHCQHTDVFQRGVRSAVALVRDAAKLYACREGTPAEVASDYPSRLALESAASNIELTLLGGTER